MGSGHPMTGRRADHRRLPLLPQTRRILCAVRGDDGDVHRFGPTPSLGERLRLGCSESAPRVPLLAQSRLFHQAAWHDRWPLAGTHPAARACRGDRGRAHPALAVHGAGPRRSVRSLPAPTCRAADRSPLTHRPPRGFDRTAWGTARGPSAPQPEPRSLHCCAQASPARAARESCHQPRRPALRWCRRGAPCAGAWP